MKSGKLIALLCAIAGLITINSPLAADSGIEVGVLNCEVIPGSRLNLLIRSTADVKCSYTKDGQSEHYIGETGIALGLDLSFKQDEKLAFSVIAASEDVRPGAKALGGKYVGGELSAAVGLGLGAKALVGGGAKNIGLQPIALETSTGIGASGGLSFLYIQPAE